MVDKFALLVTLAVTSVSAAPQQQMAPIPFKTGQIPQGFSEIANETLRHDMETIREARHHHNNTAHLNVELATYMENFKKENKVAGPFVCQSEHHNVTFHERSIENAFTWSTYLVQNRQYIPAYKKEGPSPALIDQSDYTALAKTFPPEADQSCQDPGTKLYSFPITHGHGIYHGKWRSEDLVIVGQADAKKAQACGLVHYPKKDEMDKVLPCRKGDDRHLETKIERPGGIVNGSATDRHHPHLRLF
ncbi:hypothetical protein EV356DRAFT_88521 [Viridothelium virens]|uniref:Uncharacterized protein n=1 Tax=Viridothelium virens TaxID=1048519 RepID=A0A6A6HDB9_VIRVR|nr:hypothetical protein EV356DRAFT_88521 [Viridothelium virens]